MAKRGGEVSICRASLLMGVQRLTSTDITISVINPAVMVAQHGSQLLNSALMC